jgi:multidrug efflux system membrane fusion protein
MQEQRVSCSANLVSTTGARAVGERRARYSVILAGIVLLALGGCGSRNTFVPPPPPKVAVAQPLQKPVTLYHELTGNTAAY